MKKSLMLALLCLGLLFGSRAAAQGTNATLSGTVADATESAIPGALVIAQNTQTGVATTTTTNEAGVYVFANLQPGTYKLSAEKTGFRKLVYNEVILDVGARAAVNLKLEVGKIEEAAVEINAAYDTSLAIGNNSVGGVINGQRIRDLPVPGRDVLSLITTQAGVIGSQFSGARIGTLNITRDGINVMDQRINSGVNSAVFTSVDFVEEVRVVTSPADAEFGRGSGQVQLITKSGTNAYHGSVFEAHRNTAMNANSWFNNANGRDPVTGKEISPRNILIRNQFGAGVGGPIFKNRTFFFASYEGQRIRTSTSTTATVYTPTARQGIFRFFPGTQNANATSTSLTAPATVDFLGNPIKPSTATGDLQAVSLFGRDPNRLVADKSGFMQKFIGKMPLPNNFRTGDGLNTAGFTWSRSDSNDFNQFNLRLDHHFKDKHQIFFTYTREKDFSRNGFLPQPYPDSAISPVTSGGDFYSLGVVSTLRSNLVNEFRVGAQRAPVRFFAPWESTEGKAQLPTANGQIYAPTTLLVTDFVNTGNDPQGRISPFYLFSDNVTWVKGRHTFKGGGELRFVSTNGFNSFTVLPRASFGAGGAAVQNINTITGITQNLTGAQNLLLDLTASVSQVQQAFNSPGGTNPAFLAGEGKQRTWREREFGVFFKDDFKVTPNLTLNLGLRYEFYGVPFEANGKAAGLVGGSASLFGFSGTSFADVFQPGRNKGTLTQVQLVGNNSPNPGSKLYNNDWNNFAPAVGLSWNPSAQHGLLKWLLGDGKQTVLRMGFGMGYERDSLRIIDVISGDQPGLRTVTTLRPSTFFDLTNVTLPLVPGGKPLDTVPIIERTQTIRAFDTNLRTAYVQNWNVTLQRELIKNVTLDVRYVGNKGSKLIRGVNINEVNTIENGILEAFRVTQAGGNSPLLDKIFLGVNVTGVGVVNGTTLTGSQAVRAFGTTAPFFAGNNVGAFANYLNTTTNFTNVAGGLLRNAGFAENFVIANPQFAGANLTGNFGNSTYHSLQIEVIKRFSHGWTLQSNYTFSKTLGDEEGNGQEQLFNFRTLRNMSQDKKPLSFDIRHVWRNSGIVELPFGPGRKFLSGGNRVISRLVERWQIGTIFHALSGTPLNLTAAVSSFNQITGTPTLVGPLPKDFGSVKVGPDGVTFFTGLTQVKDPSVANITTLQGVQARSTLLAVADASGKLLLVNPTPGQIGTLAFNYLRNPGTFQFDLNLIKRVKITESKNLEFRADAINFLNHPLFNGPNANINSTSFGRITGAGGARIMVVTLRVNF